MNIKDMQISELKPYENNPRINDKAVDYVANSIKEFGFKVPIIIDKDDVIVAGHTRLKAAEKLGLKSVPVIVADDLTPEQIKAFRLADNKTSEFAEWDSNKLFQELSELNQISFDMSVFGFTDEEKEKSEKEYTTKTNIPQYEIQGEKPEIEELCDTNKQMDLIEEIESAEGITKDEKEFLKLAAYRHDVFNYRKIAEYYAQASPEMQRLMEKSALVIIDLDDAIANGYAKLQKRIEELRYEDNAR